MRWCRLSILLSLTILTSACGRTSQGLQFPPRVRAKSLLVSEIVTSTDRKSIVDCPLDVRNLSDQEQVITLLGTGCSCYGITVEGRPIAQGESLTIDPSGTLRLNISAAPAEIESEKEYRANFEIRSPTGQTIAHEARCVLSVYADVQVTPQVVSCRWEPGQDLSGSRTLNISHAYRAPAPRLRPPHIEDLPDFAVVENTRIVGQPARLEDDLWRESWQAELKVQGRPPEGSSTSLFPLRVNFLDQQGSLLTSGSIRLMVELTLPLAFPNRVHFGSVSIGRTVERRILITSRNESDFRLSADAASLPPEIHVEIENQPAARQWVTIRFTPTSAGEFLNQVTLQTNRPDQRQMDITVESRVRDESLNELN